MEKSLKDIIQECKGCINNIGNFINSKQYGLAEIERTNLQELVEELDGALYVEQTENKMKKYDISDNFRERIFTIKITFQYQEYKGHIAYEVGGNCRGLDVMDVDFDCMDKDYIDNLKENDCNFKFNDEYECYELILKDEEGNICEINDIVEDEINDYVVAIEIIDCRIDED